MLPNIMLDSNTLIDNSESLLNEIEDIMNNIKFTITINNIYLNAIMDLISNKLTVNYYDDEINIDNISDSINILYISIFFTYGEDTSNNIINIINNIELERLKLEINLLVNIINGKTIIYKTKLIEHIENKFNTDNYIITDLINSLVEI